MSSAGPTNARRRATERGVAVVLSLTLHAIVVANWPQPSDRQNEAGGPAVYASIQGMPGREAAAQEAPEMPAHPNTAERAPEAPVTPSAEIPPPMVSAPTEGADIPPPDALALQAAPIALGPSSAELRAAELMAQAAQEGGGAQNLCKVGSWLAATLQDKEVAGVVAQVPRDARSVANAINVWNGDWIVPSPAAALASEALRKTILAAMTGVPETCLRAPQTGPMLIVVNVDDETLLLAIGSGDWSWSDLVDPAPAAEGSPTRTKFFFGGLRPF